MPSTYEKKVAFRNKALKVRQKVTEPAEKSRRISKMLFQSSHWDSSKIICLYLSFRTEVDTGLIFSEAIKEKKRVVIPKVEDNSLLGLYLIQSGEDLAEGIYGIMEPSSAITSSIDRKIDPSQISMILVPALAFDVSGNRLGYGKGCYDRLLANVPETCIKLGLAFSDQILKGIPTEPFDQKVDMILTEDGFITVEK